MPTLARFLVLAALACSPGGAVTSPEPNARTVQLSRPFTLAVGQSAAVGSPARLTVTFERVAADSRCPIDVQCAWAGDAEVRLRLAGAGGAADVALHTTLEPRQAEHLGYRVRLVRLQPEPRQGERIATYEAVLEVERP